ncbi:MAG: tRNA pseudouridine(38-40) synthase TruA [Gammaproteobacteria bacterium]|nr:tRNA pseudouridine(38-40) synthase TruA [Gammaproteobacteria bacterium]
MSIPARFAACIEYNGKNYNGWQRQSHAPSIQKELENAISQVANEAVRVSTSGRTDTGVHATGQVIHFDINSRRTERELVKGANRYLPDDVCILWSIPVDADFHARFSALERRYRYVILNRPIRPAYLHGSVTWHRPILDVVRMQSAAANLLGKHDFSAFRAAGCQSKTSVKTILDIQIHRQDDWVWMDISANGFLQHMVRNIMGVLMRIGEGVEPPEWSRHVLETHDRKQGGITSPAEGLYFVSVTYDAKFQLPKIPSACRFW